MDIIEVPIGSVQPLFGLQNVITSIIEERIKKNIANGSDLFFGVDPIPVIKTPDEFMKGIREWEKYTFVSGLDRYKAVESLRNKKEYKEIEGLRNVKVLVYGEKDNFEDVKRITGGSPNNRAWSYYAHWLYLSDPRVQ